jgi:hypothetical protein
MSVNLRVLVVTTAIFQNTVFGVLAALALGGVLSTRSFGVTGLAAMAAFGSAWYLVLKSVNADDAMRHVAHVSIKGLYIRAAICSVLLVFSALPSRDGLLRPRLVEVSLPAFFLFAPVLTKRL